MKTRSPLPQEQSRLEVLQRNNEQHWELAELIKQKDDHEKSPMSQELAEALQNPVPFKEPDYPSPLLDLFCTLKIEPPCFATPEDEEDITSTPPTSPNMQINHMDLCTIP